MSAKIDFNDQNDIDELGFAMLKIATERKLTNMQLYVSVMYVAGGLASANEIKIGDPNMFTTFKNGYDNYKTFNANSND